MAVSDFDDFDAPAADTEDGPSFLLMRPLLSRRVTVRLSTAYTDALDRIRQHRAAIVDIARALFQRGTLGGGEVTAPAAGRARAKGTVMTSPEVANQSQPGSAPPRPDPKRRA